MDAGEWVRYRRSPDRPLEAMHARFASHVYHRHTHGTYSFGVTEAGVQEFTCRGGRYASGRGMVMAFNPDDPHDGHAGDPAGFVYRMVHIGPDLVTEVLAEALGRAATRPLFSAPLLRDERLAGAVRRLHAALMGPATALERDERLTAAVAALHRRASRPVRAAAGRRAASRSIADTVRERLHADFLSDLPAEALAEAAGTSRFAVYRSFRAAYGMSPSDYQRLLRTRAARDLLAAGVPPARVAPEAGFADQAHLNRWFVRYFGLTPGAYRRAVTR
ncbi:AraC family transcriptional regulator [Rhizomonospora bruguierae]|uniref:AraC family transcriptional regulator n=1 Tax=Rhizomonospora bruguierae TaxID=1581705 RepID=UPI001BCBE1BA|nr:AraC family transcriptional regulator [Micromonospora sp. NBRC 107566]